ncbi:hypothetical protein D917_10342 [Trichinella nativa]|uniref:Uncharacterized protein n=1 Tax=Trichinella nativa TaxID=6335 RepID=A0A1Y3EEH2_9BILA|nr:hypothetical protein D917_10342 [Trichinella nativa]
MRKPLALLLWIIDVQSRKFTAHADHNALRWIGNFREPSAGRPLAGAAGRE